MKKTLIAVLVLAIATGGAFAYLKTKPTPKQIVPLEQNQLISSGSTTEDAKDARLYQEAIDSALTKKFEGNLSGISYGIHTPKGFYATTTKEPILGHEDKGAIELTKFYKNNEPYYPFMEMYVLPYDEKLMANEKKAHTYKRGSPSYAYSSYEELSNRAGASFNTTVSKVTANDEGGAGEEAYFVYIFPRPENQDKVLVIRKTVDTFEMPAIMNSGMQQFFRMVDEISVW